MAVNRIPPEEPDLSPAEIKTLVADFKRRLGDLEKFNPDAVTARTDPHIRALEVSIDNALREAFGKGTRAYLNYRPATALDTAQRNYAYPVPTRKLSRDYT